MYLIGLKGFAVSLAEEGEMIPAGHSTGCTLKMKSMGFLLS